jgi:hypothetical protein
MHRTPTPYSIVRVGVCALGGNAGGGHADDDCPSPSKYALNAGAAKFALTTKTEHPYNVRILDMYTIS